MATFVVIDLAQQAPYIPLSIRAWPRDRVVSWLRLYGDVIHLPHPFTDGAFLFRSWCGIETAIDFREDGRLSIIGDHTARLVWLPSQPPTS
jgi:hypothetical protein